MDFEVSMSGYSCIFRTDTIPVKGIGYLILRFFLKFTFARRAKVECMTHDFFGGQFSHLDRSGGKYEVLMRQLQEEEGEGVIH